MNPVVDVIVSEELDIPLPFETDRLERFAAEVLGEDVGGMVNIVFVDDAAMERMNRRFKGREGTTDVLSFLLSEEGEPLEGEVYISLEKARRQAVEYGVTEAEEIVRLTVHGLLHLMGHVHGTDEERESMNGLTGRWLSSFFSGGDAAR